ncbi:MAG: AraC family transcriptional regulator, partial [Oscillospiraceae bacterium]
TEAFLNDLYKIIDEVVTTANITYPIELEKDLQDAIVHGDSVLSKELLNKLLGHIFFNSNGDFATIKARVLELIVLLSRSAIEGGANIKEIFALNSNYLKEVENFRNIEKLSVWLTSVINRFVSYVFEFGEVKHTDTIYKVTGYIKENYSKKISLDEIAKHVYLSKSYLSKIFKEEMGLSITTYINNYRIEKGKILIKDDSLSLVDIANMIGFDDQGYFTKVFKASVGVSPGKYREKQGKV